MDKIWIVWLVLLFYLFFHSCGAGKKGGMDTREMLGGVFEVELMLLVVGHVERGLSVVVCDVARGMWYSSCLRTPCYLLYV